MDLGYILASAISYLGLFGGFILMLIAPEEQKPGIRYFYMMQHVVLTLILAVMLYSYNLSMIINIIVSTGFLWAISYMRHKKIKFLKSTYLYGVLGAVFYLAYTKAEFQIIASLIFLYGLPTASITADVKNKWKSLAEIFLGNIAFLMTSIGLYLFFNV